MRPVVLVLVAAVLASPGAQAADGETCQGKEATIVQQTGTVNGTDGDDVIVGGAGTRVRAGKGDDTICVTGHKVQGGQGRDSVEMRGGDAGGDFLLVDVERVDVETGAGHDSVFLEWSDSRSEHVLAGRIDGRDGDDRLWVTGARDISVDLPREKVRLTPGASVDVSGFESAFAVAWRRGRVVGDAGDTSWGWPVAAPMPWAGQAMTTSRTATSVPAETAATGSEPRARTGMTSCAVLRSTTCWTAVPASTVPSADGDSTAALASRTSATAPDDLLRGSTLDEVLVGG